MDEWSWEQVADFLSEKPRLGRLATTGKDAEPHVVPIWFRLTGKEIHIHSMRDSGKVDNIAENGRFSLVVDKDDPPYKGVTMRGSASILDGDSFDWAGLVKELAVTYLGPEMGPGYGEFIAGMDGEHITIALTPEDWEAWDYNQG